MMRCLTIIALALCLLGFGVASADDLTPKQQLGKLLFFDENLSTSPGQSCATCHAPSTGWVGPVSDLNEHGAVYPGAIHTRFGDRKPPSVAYATYSPDFYFDEEEGIYVGGMFWDGRALNTVEQAGGPFLNPVEQNNPNKRNVVRKVYRGQYSELFLQVYADWWMENMLDDDSLAEMIIDLGDDMFVETAYQVFKESISDYEGSPEVNQFSSKFDAYLQACLAAGNSCETCGLADGPKEMLDPANIFTAQEFEGLIEFGEYCSPCHISHEFGPGGVPPLFTDYTYDNIGVPRNPENPWYTMSPSYNPLGYDWIDYGLGGRLGIEEELGKMKVPTVRNVGMRPYEGFVQAYMHNGVFKSLEEVVHFYNTRDVPSEGWAPPEVPVNVNREIFEGKPLGNFELDAEAEAAIVAFMNTLTDGWMPPAPMTVVSATPRLLDSAPNPFHNATRLRFGPAVTGKVSVSVYDVSGRLMRTLAGNPDALVWDGRDARGERVAPGVYFYRLDSDRTKGEVRRVVLLP